MAWVWGEELIVQVSDIMHVGKDCQRSIEPLVNELESKIPRSSLDHFKTLSLQSHNVKTRTCDGNSFNNVFHSSKRLHTELLMGIPSN